ncbi:MAG TPA: LTA synthase family protein [Flavisolibacter sp.]|jgi:phosphoglycerol transferase MdoB-like AlkP superfamily enzyme|nr:LTA synthase family protein [Flavisolibacter sp.]
MSKIPRLLKWIGTVLLLFFVLLTVFRFVFYWVYKPAAYTFPGEAFLMGLRLDLRVICVIGLLMLLLCALPFLNPFRKPGARRFWSVFLSLLFFLLLFFYIVDFFHYDYLHQRLNASVLNYLQDAGISMNMVWQTYPVLRALLLIILLVAAAAFLFGRLVRGFQRQERKRIRRGGLWTVPFVLLLLAGAWGSLGQFALRWSDVFTLKDAFKAQLALNPVQSFFSTLSFKNATFDEKKARAAYPLMSDYLGVRQQDSSGLNYTRTLTPQPGLLPARTRPNIVLVICESFSAYKSSMWGNPLNPTPFFNSLCSKGIFFDHCFTPSYGTARGIWAAITGIPDVESPTTASRNPAIVDQNTLINAFQGYDKFYFLGGSASWANIRGLLKYNIDGLKLYEQDDYNAARIDVWGVSDKNLFLEANKILGQQQKPFFAVIQTADNHRPYTIPEEDLTEFKKVRLPEDSLKKYGYSTNDELNAFRYTDFGYQKFIEAAQKQPYFRNTIFVFVGDHGIRGDAGAMFPRAWTDQALTTVHVPLLFYSPLLPAQRRSNVVSQLDILPSLAGLSALPFTNTTMGRNLFDSALMQDPFRSSSAFIIDPDEKKIGMIGGDYYLRKFIQKPGIELVSLKDNQPVTKGPLYDSLKTKLSAYSDAFYETARYLLYHNKKSTTSVQ